jgi:hypothetical protein
MDDQRVGDSESRLLRKRVGTVRQDVSFLFALDEESREKGESSEMVDDPLNALFARSEGRG